MKYDLRSIMVRAWIIKKRNKKNLFSLSLKMAWREAKRLRATTLLRDFIHGILPKCYRRNITLDTMIKKLDLNNIAVPDKLSKLLV